MEHSFISYIHFQIKSFRKNFIHSTSRRNFNEIHDYRVALKRIRTIVNFIQRIPGGRNLKPCYKINNLRLAFKSGGVLREMQINRIILKKYEQSRTVRYTDFRKYIKQKEKNAFIELKISRNKFSAKKINKFEAKLVWAIQKIPTPLIVENIDQFIEKRITQIEKLVKDRNVESTLHRIRRQTKSIKYLLEMSKTESRSYGDLKFEVGKITELEDLIGNWHDQQVFKLELEKHISVIRKRKSIDDQTKSLMTAVRKDYNTIFKQTVKAVYNHYKIPSGKKS